MKKKCLKKKKLIKFYKKRNGVQNQCKKCDNIRRTLTNRTKEGLMRKMYTGQQANSKQRNHSSPKYTYKDFKSWLLAQKKFHHLFHLWEISNYDTLLKPSVDRKRVNDGYNFSNIQLMTWGENQILQHVNVSKKVKQFTLDNIYITEYPSIRAAERQTGVHRSNIIKCIAGKVSQTGGFKWGH